MKINYLNPEIKCIDICTGDVSLCEVSFGEPGVAGNPLIENDEYTYEL